jgi:hypothetical protein
MTWKHMVTVAAAASALSIGVLAQAQQAAAPPAAGGKADAVAALKQALGQGMAKARQYEWVETTIISLKGEEKARKQNRCYYGADGKVQKISLDQPAAQEKPQAGGGRKGRMKEKVIEGKKDDMQEYMKSAAALIHSYVPPDPAKIQAAKDAGRVAAKPQAGGAVNVAISDYLQPGDALTIGLDPAAAKLLSLAVNTYLEKKEDTVTLNVKMNSLPDGALYVGETTLEAKAKNIAVVIQNTGHKPVAK